MYDKTSCKLDTTGCLAVGVPTLNVNNFFISQPIIKPFDSMKVKASRISLMYGTPCKVKFLSIYEHRNFWQKIACFVHSLARRWESWLRHQSLCLCFDLEWALKAWWHVWRFKTIFDTITADTVTQVTVTGTVELAGKQNGPFFVKSRDGHKLRKIELYKLFHTSNKFYSS